MGAVLDFVAVACLGLVLARAVVAPGAVWKRGAALAVLVIGAALGRGDVGPALALGAAVGVGVGLWSVRKSRINPPIKIID